MLDELLSKDGHRLSVAFSAIATFLIAKLADLLVGLRVDAEHETQGLDFATHGETGYHMNR